MPKITIYCPMPSVRTMVTDTADMLHRFLSQSGHNVELKPTKVLQIGNDLIHTLRLLFIQSSDGWFSFLDHADQTDLLLPGLANHPDCRTIVKLQYHSLGYSDKATASIAKGDYFEAFPRAFQDQIDSLRTVSKTQTLPFFMGQLRGSRKRICASLCIPIQRTIAYNKYIRSAASHYVGLALTGIGGLCYREIEYCGMGVVPLMMPHKNLMLHPLVPDKHFIAAKAFAVDKKTDTQERIRRLKKAYFSVIDDKIKLETMRQEGMAWYDTHIRYPNYSRNLAIQFGLI